MTPDQRRRLQLAGAAAARELLAWLAEVAEIEADDDLLIEGGAVATAALRAVLGAAREPSAAGWSMTITIETGGIRAWLAAPPDLAGDELEAIRAEIRAGFRDAATPASADEADMDPTTRSEP